MVRLGRMSRLLRALLTVGFSLLATEPAWADDPEVLQMVFPGNDKHPQTPGQFTLDFLRIAELVTRDSGLAFVWTPLPMTRTLRLLQSGTEQFCIGGAGITPERAAVGQFSHPFMEDRWLGLLALREQEDRLTHVHSFDELAAEPETNFLTELGANLGQKFAETLAKLGPRLSNTARTDDQLLDMIKNHRADYAIMPKVYIENVLADRPDRDRFIVVGYPDMRRDFQVAFLCSRAVPHDVIDKLNAAIARQMPIIREKFPDFALGEGR